MPVTYENIATTTLSTNGTTVNFTSISSAFTDLILVVDCSTTGAQDINLRFNSDSGSNYSRTYFYGNGTSALSARESNQNVLRALYTTTTRGVSIVQINNYANTVTNKTVLTRFGDSGNATAAGVGLWRSTAAINSISIFAISENFVSGSTFTLYGIKAA